MNDIMLNESALKRKSQANAFSQTAFTTLGKGVIITAETWNNL